MDALHTITPNLADLPHPNEHGCLAYHYTKPGRSTPDLLADLPPNRAWMPCIPLHQTWQIYPTQMSMDALHTITPNLADLLQICWQIYPPAIKHRCLVYCYTKPGRSTPDMLADLLPATHIIEHRCLEYHYTKPGNSSPPKICCCIWMAISPFYCYSSYRQINWQIYPQKASSGHAWQLQISIVTAHIGRSTGRCTTAHSNASWDIYYGMYLAAILDSSRKGGNFLLFLNN